MDRVLVNLPLRSRALDLLKSEVEVVEAYDKPVDKVKELLPEIDGIILAQRLSLDGPEMDRAKRLKVIARRGVGLDTVDIAAASERGLPVVYTPYGPTESTAEHTFLLIMATAKRLPKLDSLVRSGDFDIGIKMLGVELQGKTLGVVGFGRIGQRVAQMCRGALDMEVLVYDPILDAEQVAALGGRKIDDLLVLASQVDVLTLHVPHIPETHKLIDAKVLSRMQTTTMLINVSRGPVVDEGALIDALKAKRLWGAGLDVYDPEPPSVENELFTMDNVVLTAHSGSATHEGRLRMDMDVASDVLRVLRGERPRYLANPEVWPLD